MGVSIRFIEEKDYEQVKDLFVNLIRVMAEYNPIRLKEPLPQYRDRYFQKVLTFIAKEHGLIGVAEDAEKVVGCISGYIKEQTVEDLLDHKKVRIGHIEDFYVLEAYRKKGIGKQLLQFIEHYFQEKKCDAIDLTVPSKNIKAHDLYTSSGYSDLRNEMIKWI